MLAVAKVSRNVVCGLLAIACMGLAAGVFAQDEEVEEKKWPFKSERLILKFGAIRTQVDTRVALDGSILLGDSVDLERDLGLDDSTTEIFGELTIRLSKRQRLEFGYVQLNRSALKTLSQTINFGDQTFTAGTLVRTTFDLDLYRAAYGYSIVNNGRRELGLTIGAHVADLKAEIFDVGGLVAEDGDMVAPLPNIGIYAGYAFTPNVAAVAKGQIFWLQLGNFEGQLINAGGAIEVYLFKPLLIGAGYSFFDLDIQATRDDFRGELNFQFHGPTAYAGIRF